LTLALTASALALPTLALAFAAALALASAAALTTLLSTLALLFVVHDPISFRATPEARIVARGRCNGCARQP
jgi:hypothetical protein